jgi:transposase-like protein
VQLLKKIGFYLFIVASVGVAIWCYIRLKENKEPKPTVIEHIPNSVSAVIETKNISDLISQLTRQNLIWNSLLNNTSVANAQSCIQYLDSISKTNSDITELINNNAVYICLFKEVKTTHSLMLFKLKEKSNETVFTDFFTKHFKKSPTATSIDRYETTMRNQKWFIAYNDGIVYLSSDEAILKRSMELPVSESMASNVNYISLLKESGSQPNQVYLNQERFKLLDHSLFAQHSLYNVEVKLNEITLNGYVMPDSVMYTLKHQEASTIDIYQHLPSHPSSIIGLSISDSKLYLKEFEKINSVSENKKREDAWKRLNDSALYDIKNEFLENIDVQIVANTYAIEKGNHRISAIKIKDDEKTTSLLALVKDSVISQNDLTIYRLQKDYQRLFALINPSHTFQYACVNNDLLVCFSDFMALEQYLQSIANSAIINKDNVFMEYVNDNLAQSSNIVYYNNTALLLPEKDAYILRSEVLVNSENAISQISVTGKNYKNLMQVRINLSHAQQKSEDANMQSSLWSFDADSSVVSNIHVFTNHLTQENELCFQDNAKQLYLISSTGNLIWKKKLNEVITSDIYTVDIFKNGKLQLLFNTEDYLHLLDRNGNYVQGYPVKLPAKVTSNMTLLDYENNKDYRIFLACANKHIYNFSLYGIKTEGFTTLKTDAIIELPIHYIKVGQSDYLITVDIMGKIYAFSRKGEGRIDFKNKTTTNLSNFYMLSGNTLDNSKLIYVDDKNNLLNKISLMDKKEALKLGDELSGFKTHYDLINDDAQMDVLAYGDGALYGYDLFSSKLIEYFSTAAVYENIQAISTSSHNYVLAFDKTGQKIDIINKDGKLIHSISNASKQPLVSNLYKNGKTYLIIANHRQVFCQELD